MALGLGYATKPEHQQKVNGQFPGSRVGVEHARLRFIIFKLYTTLPVRILDLFYDDWLRAAWERKRPANFVCISSLWRFHSRFSHTRASQLVYRRTLLLEEACGYLALKGQQQLSDYMVAHRASQRKWSHT